MIYEGSLLLAFCKKQNIYFHLLSIPKLLNKHNLTQKLKCNISDVFFKKNYDINNKSTD